MAAAGRATTVAADPDRSCGAQSSGRRGGPIPTLEPTWTLNRLSAPAKPMNKRVCHAAFDDLVKALEARWSCEGAGRWCNSPLVAGGEWAHRLWNKRTKAPPRVLCK